jgi:hypothetical protein
MKRAVLTILLITVIALSGALIGYYWANLNNRQIDTSWVAKAEGLLQGYQPYNNTQPNSLDVTLAYCNMYLVENGTEQLIYYGNGDALSTYLGELLENATVQKGTVNQDHLDRVLATDRAVILSYRISILAMSDPTAKYYMGYFILEDDLNEGLEGTIIAREISSNGLSLLAVSR